MLRDVGMGQSAAGFGSRNGSLATGQRICRSERDSYDSTNGQLELQHHLTGEAGLIACIRVF